MGWVHKSGRGVEEASLERGGAGEEEGKDQEQKEGAELGLEGQDNIFSGWLQVAPAAN